MNQRLFLWSLTSALAGFLFGFDTIVISGAEQKIQSIWNLDSAMHGLCMSAALWGTVLGALLGGWPTERFGRRKTLLWIGVLYFVSAVGQGAVIWVFISEIFPNRNRAAGQALGSSTHWLFAALLTLVFPKMAEALSPSVIFGFFCFMMVLQLLWVKMCVPETKGVPLEEMQARLGIADEFEVSRD